MTAPPNRPGDLPGQAAPTLADALAAGAFTVPEAVRVAIEIAQAVEALHEQGMVHRGIDPRAIFLTDQGVIVAAPDGVEVVPDATQQVGLDQDRAAHSPPEAFLDEGPLTPASDVYALGSLLFRMLAGQPAFRRRGNESSLQYILRLQRDPIPPFRRTDVPQDLRDVIERAMAKEPAHRYPDAHAFADALYPFAPPETTRAPTRDGSHVVTPCPRCGAPLRGAVRFCGRCGTPIGPASPDDTGKPPNASVTSTTGAEPAGLHEGEPTKYVDAVTELRASRDDLGRSGARETTPAATTARGSSWWLRRPLLTGGTALFAVALLTVFVLTLTGGGDHDARGGPTTGNRAGTRSGGSSIRDEPPQLGPFAVRPTTGGEWLLVANTLEGTAAFEARISLSAPQPAPWQGCQVGRADVVSQIRVTFTNTGSVRRWPQIQFAPVGKGQIDGVWVPIGTTPECTFGAPLASPGRILDLGESASSDGYLIFRTTTAADVASLTLRVIPSTPVRLSAITQVQSGSGPVLKVS